MNLVVNDLDMPLIIKWLLYQKKEVKCILLIMMNTLKATFADEDGVMYDNDETCYFLLQRVVDS
jgi:hypothetical protein